MLAHTGAVIVLAEGHRELQEILHDKTEYGLDLRLDSYIKKRQVQGQTGIGGC